MIKFVHPSLESYRRRAPRPERREGGKRLNGQPPRRGTPEQPLVTVVTAVWNSRFHFARCIESVLDQTYPNVEYVIIDGASTDGTVEVIEAYQEGVDYWVTERDQSMFDGMNRGIAASSGELVKIHGADDVMGPDSVGLAVERYLERRDDADSIVIRGDMELVDDDEHVLELVTASTRVKHSPSVLHPTWYVPMALYERHGLYDPNTVVASDYEMYFYLLEAGVEFIHIHEPLTRFRSGGTSTATLAGLADGFLINRRYQGLRIATQLAAVAGARRSTRMVLEKLIGSDRVNDLRRRMGRS